MIGLAENVLTKPASQLENRAGYLSQLRQLVKLNTQDAFWFDSRLKQVINYLIQKRCLANLPRATEYLHRCETVA